MIWIAHIAGEATQYGQSCIVCGHTLMEGYEIKKVDDLQLGWTTGEHVFESGNVQSAELPEGDTYVKCNDQ